MNQVSNNKQEVIPPSQTTFANPPVAKAAASPVVRRVVQFGATSPSCPFSPTSPASPALSEVRMVLFHDVGCEWTQVTGTDDNQEWVILDSGSEVSRLPARNQAEMKTPV